MEILSREKIQLLADVYLSESYNEFCNRSIQSEHRKFLLFNQIPQEYDNPRIVFCYIHKVLGLYEKLDCFKNNFILITAEEDTRITEELYKKIADHPKILKWYTQNLCFIHEKIIPIPIGIRNEEWGGNINFFTELININIPKTKKMYFNFIKETNPIKRNECYNKLCNYYEFLPLIKYEDNLLRLAEHEFCICPEGNGVDTHRLCESWYLKVVPIVLENDFILTIKKFTDLPLIILKDWNDLITFKLDYNNYKDQFKYDKYLDFNYYKNIFIYKLNIDIISGEKMQILADVYIAPNNDFFMYNPAIGIDKKNLLIKDIPNNYDNPKVVYCYTNCLNELYDKIDCFLNNFVLISGNSDEDIIENKYKKIADHPKIIKWYSQNVCFKHNKLEPFTIGIANEQWQHGNSREFINTCNQVNEKNNDIYFNFSYTSNKRNICFDKLKDYIPFLNNINPIDNFKRLGSYKFCICPEGNGVDTHRLAECWYLRVVPIVVESDFINAIKDKSKLPIIILKDWTDLLKMTLNYNDYDFSNNNYINYNYYKNEINLLKN